MPRDAPGGAVSLSRCARRIRFPYGALRVCGEAPTEPPKLRMQGRYLPDPLSGDARRLAGSFASTCTGSVTPRLHHGLVRKVAGLLGREIIRVRFPAGPPTKKEVSHAGLHREV